MAAFESAYLIANNQAAVDGDGYPTISVSEQEALDCSTPADDCVAGGWHEDALMYLRTHGLVSGGKWDNYPYREIKTVCTEDLGDRPFYALNLGYVTEPTPANVWAMPADVELKSVIFNKGPVASAVATDNWGGYWKYYDDGNDSVAFPSRGPARIINGTLTARYYDGMASLSDDFNRNTVEQSGGLNAVPYAIDPTQMEGVPSAPVVRPLRNIQIAPGS